MTRVAAETGGGGGAAASSKSENALLTLRGGGGNMRLSSPFSLINSSSNRYGALKKLKFSSG